MERKDRYFGILLHPTSFNSPFGIGDLGAEAKDTLKLLADAGVRLWQILPLGPTGFGDSPYSARSTFAGNEYLIDLRQIEGFDCTNLKGNVNSSERVDYSDVAENKMQYLKLAAQAWFENHSDDRDFRSFTRKNKWWLDDYALFQSLVNHFKDSRWSKWETGLRTRDPKTLRAWTRKLSNEISVYKTLQYHFFKQWDSLHRYANSLGIRIIGDIPIFCAGDSSDVWTNQRLFKIDANGVQLAGAGVPPDAFSPTGQMWGNPVYNWEECGKDDYAWYRKRVEMTLKMVDIVRIDHFRGLQSYWEVPRRAKDARRGKWMPGPSMDLIRHFKDKDIIAEDLGVITKDVEQLLSDSGFPGMKVLQFAFDIRNSKLDKNSYLPYNYPYNCVAYTGTHDNNTTRGWFNSLSDDYKDIVRRFLQCPDEEVTWQMIRAICASSAKYAVIPMQDLMDLDESARMNAPSTVSSSNWSWRMDPKDLQQWRLDRLREFINLYGRY